MAELCSWSRRSSGCPGQAVESQLPAEGIRKAPHVACVWARTVIHPPPQAFPVLRNMDSFPLGLSTKNTILEQNRMHRPCKTALMGLFGLPGPE